MYGIEQIVDSKLFKIHSDLENILLYFVVVSIQLCFILHFQ